MPTSPIDPQAERPSSALSGGQDDTTALVESYPTLDHAPFEEGATFESSNQRQPNQMDGEAGREARDEIAEFLSEELVGPVAMEEVLNEPPSSRYLCGMLAPWDTEVEASEAESLPVAGGDEDGENGTVETEAPQTHALFPSSLGLSFLVDGLTEKLAVAAKWGEYTRSERDDDTGKSIVEWQRIAQGESLTVDLGVGAHSSPLQSNTQVTIDWIVRPIGDALAVSLFLVNRQQIIKGPNKDERWLFQPSLTVEPTVPGGSPFLSRATLDPGASESFPDADLQSYNLLYRKRRMFAVGLGCSCDWNGVTETSDRASRVMTTIVPMSETPRYDPRASGPPLDMLRIADAESAEDISNLSDPILQDYEIWIKDLRKTAEPLDITNQQTAHAHAEECSTALRRIRDGLDVLRSDHAAFEAFRFANRAMLLQRSYSNWARDYRRSGVRTDGEPPLKATWYPFQFMFILMNLRGICDETHADRQACDLLWFPTGGGKTEAYLGLAVFAMALRRLRGDTPTHRADRGVTVLMRYTLRLLTIQQFQRASALICACELIRESDPSKWGSERFSIGLWVGGQTTPNTFDDSEVALTQLSQDPEKHCENGNPMQLLACPWCGERLSVSDYYPDRDRRRTLVSCPRSQCPFSKHISHFGGDGLPVLVVDEEIYRECPSMLVGTVDKFARMPWKAEVKSLFGEVDRFCPRHGFVVDAEQHPTSHRARGGRPTEKIRSTLPLLPPQLIIQDELHLITGPLGTLVGLYESAIEWLTFDRMAGDKIIPPKIVASTATIRRANEQVRRLFTRRMYSFPPPGIDAADSFFARELPIKDSPGRRYVGIFAPGKSMKTAIDRVYAALLVAASKVFQQSQTHGDPYMTLVGYFNSLRELGGTVRLLEDDIPMWMLRIVQRPENLGIPNRSLLKSELTSRMTSSEIPKILDQLENSFASGNGERPPIDVLLATNMISVGVDVNRLGLMVVAGQPKTTAEYIQATSRIGRSAPGLVVTIFNWARFRDLSHHERFRTYHETLYRHVEGTTVTPFSSRARDRALHAAFVSMVRLSVPSLARNDQASRFDPDDAQVRGIMEALESRARTVSGTVIAAEVRQELLALSDEWRRATIPGNLRYALPSQYIGPANTSDLLLRSAGSDENDGLWPTPDSMRDVEPQAGVFLLGRKT